MWNDQDRSLSVVDCNLGIGCGGLLFLPFLLVMVLVTTKMALEGQYGSAVFTAVVGALACWFLLRVIGRAIKARRRLLGRVDLPAKVESKAPKVPEAFEISTRPGSTDSMTCAFCRDTFDLSPVMLCPACEVRLHPDCWNELEACPTIGCSAGRPKKQRAQGLKDPG